MNALSVIETLTPAIFSQEGGIDAMLTKLEADVRAVQTDISTPKGRKEVASLAFKVARSKTAFDDMGKDLVADLKKQTGAIDAERKKVRDRLDALKEEVRRPLDEYEAAEELRIAGHQAAIRDMQALAGFIDENPPSEAVIRALTVLDALPGRDWQEFKQKAATARSETFAKLQGLKDVALQREAEAFEAACREAERLAQEQRERDERIAAEAAAEATRIAEARAEADRQRVERETAEAVEQAAAAQRAVESERAAANARAEKAESDAIEAAARAERDRVAAAEQAEADRVAAVEAERQRVADAQAAEVAETQRREADREHRKAINSEALAAFIAAGLGEADGVKAITAIVRGAVPHISIRY